MEPAVALFRSLGDPARLAIVRRLAAGEARVSELTRDLGLAQSTVSKHIASLHECRLLTARPEGRATWYALAEPERLRGLITAAERVLTATGAHAVLCQHLHTTEPHQPAAS